MNKGLNKLVTIILSISLSLFFICLAVKFTVGFRQLYYYDLDHLNIARDYGMSRETIIKNYNILIDYNQKKNITKLKMPEFQMSEQGETHFKEVKVIFMKFNTMLYISGIISILGIILKLKQKSFSFLKWSSIELIAMPVILAIPFGINFDASFTAFHKLFFTNDYWEFDPVKDPIINVLPQEFFFHCAVLILGIIALSSLVLYVLYRNTKKYSKA